VCSVRCVTVCEQLLLLSMKDMNIAKLSTVDVPLFNGIISDLFPGVESPVIDYSKVYISFCTVAAAARKKRV